MPLRRSTEFALVAGSRPNNGLSEGAGTAVRKGGHNVFSLLLAEDASHKSKIKADKEASMQGKDMMYCSRVDISSNLLAWAELSVAIVQTIYCTGPNMPRAEKAALQLRSL